MWRKYIAYGLLLLSTVLWLAILALPFLDLEGSEIASVTVALIIAGEVSFYVAIALMGKEAWQKIKSFFQSKKKKAQDQDAQDHHSEHNS